VYFYELHEGSGDVFHDLLLFHEDELDPTEFFELVQSIRREVQDRFEQDSLIEAIGEELEREHGFIVISDDRLTAAVNVSPLEDENELAEVARDDDDGDDNEFRTLYARFDPDADLDSN